MAYEAITDNDIVVGRPAKRSLWQKIKGNFEHLFSIAVEGGLKNGSFETDTDEDGIPDNWTRSLYPGGSAGFDTDNPMHGTRAYRFTHPGGGGNGGGYLDSDYVEVSSLDQNSIKLNIRSSVSGIRNIVQVRYFDKDKVFLSSADLYNATAPDANARSLSYNFTPPANARYIKIRLIGGYTDTDVAGSTYFDGVQLFQSPDTAITLSKLKMTQGSYSYAFGGDVYITVHRYSHYPDLYKYGSVYSGRMICQTDLVSTGAARQVMLSMPIGNGETFIVYWDYHSN
ncbi:MAG: hypothetical protein QY316_00505 [Thermodesulfobacteriota bacterium]|nr:MAG: hypothetical protein QY316_00505 [Thermodesulfobacteriota bacterium]